MSVKHLIRGTRMALGLSPEYTPKERKLLRDVRQINARRANDRISCIYCWGSWKTFRGWERHMTTKKGLKTCHKAVERNRKQLGLKPLPH